MESILFVSESGSHKLKVENLNETINQLIKRSVSNFVKDEKVKIYDEVLKFKLDWDQTLDRYKSAYLSHLHNESAKPDSLSLPSQLTIRSLPQHPLTVKYPGGATQIINSTKYDNIGKVVKKIYKFTKKAGDSLRNYDMTLHLPNKQTI